MFLVAFLIMLREGIEAALIVGIIAGFLKQSGRKNLVPYVWLGSVLAALMCLGVGYGIHKTTGEIPQKQQELVVGIIGIAAVGVLTYMLMWMKKVGRDMKKHLESTVGKTIKTAGNKAGWALVVMAFLAVAREGLESIFFLIAVFEQSPTWTMPIGAVLGLCAAVVFGLLMYQGTIHIPLHQFFKWTGIFIIFVAAGLLAGSLRALHEAGVWNYLQTIVFNSQHILPEDGVFGVMLAGIFGYSDHPTVGEIAIYLLYLIPTLFWFTRNKSIPRSQLIKDFS